MLFRNATQKQIDAGLTILRVVVGLVFVMHGGQKLFVYGLEGLTGSFGQMGIPMAGVSAPLVAFTEFLGGFALIAGLLTRLAAFGLAVTMIGATFLVHWKAGFFAPNGYEFTLTLFSATALLALTGAGGWSIDALINRRIDGDAVQTATVIPSRRAA